ncbi:hypothetical protein LOTGIDRAFT_122743, partial [Lottia gigantea]
MLKYFLLLILATYIFSTTNSEISEPCVNSGNRTVCYCTRNKTYVNCSSQGLKKIPQIKFKYKVLDFSNNALRHLNSFMFTLFPNLQKLYIDRNCIYKIASSRIDCLKKLKYLNISELHMEIIPNNLFSKLTSLRRLYIEHTEYNGITKIPANYLSPLKKLLQLYLNDNKLSKINEGDLPKSLEIINLAFNPLTRNDITSVPSFCNGKEPIFPNLKNLYLDKNCLFHITPENIDCLKNLESLNISQTNMHYLPDNMFNSLTSLRTLSLEYTGFNGIKRVNPDFFAPLKKLKILYLNGNKITRVYENDLPENLEVLNLSYNPFICDCKL